MSTLKQRLVEAHRSQNWEAAKVLSQEKERAKRRAANCSDCGVAIRPGAARCFPCSTRNRYYRRALAGVAVLMIATGLCALGAAVCVGPSATGSGSGSDWSNIKAFSTLNGSGWVRGNTYYLRSGSYGGLDCDTAQSGTTAVTIKAALAGTGNHGTETGWSDAMAGLANFGNSSITSPYWTISGGARAANWTNGYHFKFSGSVSNENAVGLLAGFANNVTLDYIEVMGMNQVGSDDIGIGEDSVSRTLSNIYVGHSYIHHTGNSQVSFNFGGGNHNILFEYCYLYRNHCGQIATSHDEGMAVICTGFVVRFCIFRDIQSTAFIANAGGDGSNNPPSGDWDIYGNLFFWSPSFQSDISFNSGCDNGVIGLPNHINGSGHFYVYNNTVCGIKGGANLHAAGFDTFTVGVSDQRCENNVWWDCPSITKQYGSFGTFDYNSFYNCPGGYVGQSEGPHDLALGTNPFVNSGVFDFHIAAATAPGVSLSTPYNADLEGNLRGGDTNFDRGAYEFVSMTNAPDPQISEQPTNVTVYQSQGATFRVTASGQSALSYQWNFLGTNVAGATQSSYTRANCALGDNGAGVYCMVTDAAGSLATSLVTLTVLPDPVITAQPENVTAGVGQTATFAIGATGQTAITFFWYRNAAFVSSGSSSNLSLSNVQITANNSVVYCVVSNAAGTVQSANAVLTVTNNPQTYYVETTGSDAANGAVNTPWRTLSHALDVANYPDTLWLRGGVFVGDNVIVPSLVGKSGGSATNRITIAAYPGERVILSGAMQVSPDNWLQVAAPLISTYSYPGTATNAFVVPDQQVGTGTNLVWTPGGAGGGWPTHSQQLWYVINSGATNEVRRPFQQLGWSATNTDWLWSGSGTNWTLTDIRPQSILTNWADWSFWWSTNNGGKLYFQCAAGFAPTNAGVSIEASVNVPLYLGGDDIVLKDLTVRCGGGGDRSTTMSQVNLHSDCLVQNCVIEWGDTGGLAVGTNSAVSNTVVRCNGLVGMNAGAKFTLVGSLNYSNNWRLFPNGWGSGGLKAIRWDVGAPDLAGTVVASNGFFGNSGFGLWFDTQQTLSGQVQIYGNWFSNNVPRVAGFPGVFGGGLSMEDSGSATGQFRIWNNLFGNNGFAAIYLLNACGVAAQYNTIFAGTSQSGIIFQGIQTKTQSPQSNSVANNIVVQGDASWPLLQSQIGLTFGGVFADLRTNNLFDGNCYQAGSIFGIMATNDPGIGNQAFNQSFAQMSAFVLPYWESDSFSANPVLSNFRPTNGSPVINVGTTNIFPVMNDFSGAARSSAPDLGAFESLPVAVTNRISFGGAVLRGVRFSR